MTVQDWTPPSAGLSDYAVSPLGMPKALLNDEVRVAFLARTSTEDHQDPRQSIIRQLTNSKNAIPPSWIITAHFYDVESGRLELDERGQGQGYERFNIPIPRAGGIADLLDEASRPNRRFDVVICENIARVARRAFEGISVERELERADVPLFASNEPLTLSGSRAQRILQRRINQSIAEYEVLNTLEQSWGGLCTHVRDGWNIGQPPYGYAAIIVPHPSPVKAEKGKTKSRLEPDGIRGLAVTQMAHWRHYEGLGCATIARRLNADPEKYPPPEAPSKARTRGSWTRSSVYDILCNPKYTGYQVFNRRATTSKRGRVNEPYKWVWSPKPVHEPLIEKWMFDELNKSRKMMQGSRGGDVDNKNPRARRKYILRGRVHHSCGRRMIGDVRREGVAYYLCWPGKNNEGKPDLHPGLPSSIRVREDELLEAICRFYADRLFGPERRAILEAQLACADDTADREREAERERRTKLLGTITRQQESILRQAREGDPDDPFTRGLRQSYNDLEKQKKETEAAVAKLDATEAPSRPTTADLGRVDALPYLAVNLARAPRELLHELFEATRLRVDLHGKGEEATITVTLPDNQFPNTALAAERISDAMTPTTQKALLTSVSSARVVADGTPDGIRTHATGVRGRRPRPLDDGGLGSFPGFPGAILFFLAGENLPEAITRPAGGSLSAAGVPGLEPRLTGPEPVVLPITPYPSEVPFRSCSAQHRTRRNTRARCSAP